MLREVPQAGTDGAPGRIDAGDQEEAKRTVDVIVA
jgi:hypothetical protein